MLSTETIITFLIASILLGLAPGPDNLFVLTQSAVHGRLAGIVVVVGLCTGLVFHSGAVVFGVATLFKTSVVAFSVLKYLGATYLMYLAWVAFRTKGTSTVRGANPTPDLGRLYRRGIIMNVTNPKVSVFFLAFLPQFTEPDRGAVTIQLVCLAALFICATILVFGAVAILAGTLSLWLKRSERVQIGLYRLTGVIFVGLALKLAMTNQ